MAVAVGLICPYDHQKKTRLVCETCQFPKPCLPKGVVKVIYDELYHGRSQAEIGLTGLTYCLRNTYLTKTLDWFLPPHKALNLLDSRTSQEVISNKDAGKLILNCGITIVAKLDYYDEQEKHLYEFKSVKPGSMARIPYLMNVLQTKGLYTIYKSTLEINHVSLCYYTDEIVPMRSVARVPYSGTSHSYSIYPSGLSSEISRMEFPLVRVFDVHKDDITKWLDGRARFLKHAFRVGMIPPYEKDLPEEIRINESLTWKCVRCTLQEECRRWS